MPAKNNDNAVSKLVNLIMNISGKVFDKKTKRFPKEWVGTISVTTPSVAPNAFADVFLNGDLTSTPMNVKNKTWETLVTGDEIFIHSPSGSLNDCIILYAK